MRGGDFEWNRATIVATAHSRGFRILARRCGNLALRLRRESARLLRITCVHDEGSSFPLSYVTKRESSVFSVGRHWVPAGACPARSRRAGTTTHRLNPPRRQELLRSWRGVRPVILR